MNRIILIGNGFDLAHGLSTKYEDFIKLVLGTMGASFTSQFEKTRRGWYLFF